MFTRSRIVRPRALLTLAVTALALAATAATASAADFTWQASVSTTQAAARADLTLTYTSSSSAALTELQVELASGSMPRRNLTGACSPQLFRADRCPSTSVVGSVSSTIVVARIPLPTNGTIYQLTESGDAANAFGIVLRPPLSALGLIGKIFIDDRITFTNGGGIRHTLSGDLNSVRVLGNQMPSRISMTGLKFNGSRGANPLFENSTTCGQNPIHARASFSDGTTANRTASHLTTGCPAVPFAPTAEVQLDNDVAGQRTTFSVLLSNTSSGALAAGHISKLTIDLSEIGPADTSVLEALPDGTEIATIAADVDSYGQRTGSIVRDSTAPSGFSGTLKLGPIVHVMIGVTIAGGKVTLTNLPQLPLKTIRIGGKPNAAWITNTCAIRTAHVIADSFSGGHVERDTTVPRPRCDTEPPVLTLLDPADMDSDGDGYADVTFRNFPTLEVLFGAEDESGIDPSSLQCSITPKSSGGPSKTGKTGAASGKYACSFTDVPPGDSVVMIQAADPYGHVTVLKLGVIIDGSPPSIAIDEPGVHLADSPTVEIPITVNDDSLFFAQGSVTVECSRKGWDGTVKGSAKIITDRDSGRSKGFCVFEDVPDGQYKVTVKGWDPVKKEGIAEGDLDVDSTAPTAQFLDLSPAPLPSDFDLFFTATDEGSGVDPDASTCAVTPRKGGVIKGAINIQSGNRFSCSFAGVPPGEAEVTVGVADHRGHVTVLKAAVTVEDPEPPPAPELSVLAPGPGSTFNRGALVSVAHTITGEGPYTFRCLVDSFVVLASCPSPSQFSTTGMSLGAHTLTVIASDASGPVASATTTFSLTSPPPDVCIAIYPPPPGCPGGPPGGPVITFP